MYAQAENVCVDLLDGLDPRQRRKRALTPAPYGLILFAWRDSRILQLFACTRIPLEQTHIITAGTRTRTVAASRNL